MAAFKYFDPYAEIENQQGSVATVATTATHPAAEPESVAELATVAGGNHENEISPPVVCIFCAEPVERGTPGTGALNGEDLHMDCYRKRHPRG